MREVKQKSRKTDQGGKFKQKYYTVVDFQTKLILVSFLFVKFV